MRIPPLVSLFRRFISRRGRFTARTFRTRDRFRSDYQLLAGSILDRVCFDSVLDIGCANGFLLDTFQTAGKRIAGVELSPAAVEVLPPSLLPFVTIGDFMVAAGTWDLVCCVEVAEHIEPQRSEELVRTLTRLAEQTIYFTAAPPGQGGRGHVNCREHADWLGWFGACGWRLDEAATDAARGDLAGLTQATWLRGNSLILRRA